MLAVSTAARLASRGARRAVVVAGQRQAAVQAVRRTSVRGIQSVAQTDRVCGGSSVCRSRVMNLFFLAKGYHHPSALFNWYQEGSRTISPHFLFSIAPLSPRQVCRYQSWWCCARRTRRTSSQLELLVSSGALPSRSPWSWTTAQRHHGSRGCHSELH